MAASVAFCSGDEHFWTETHLKSSSVYLAAQINKKRELSEKSSCGGQALWLTGPLHPEKCLLQMCHGVESILENQGRDQFLSTLA